MLGTLIKTQLSYSLGAMFRRSSLKRGSGTGFKVLMTIIFVYVGGVFLALFGGMFSSMVEPFAAAGLDWLYFAFMGILAFALSFIGSIFMAQHTLFEAKDNELLLSMPIKPVYILISRMFSIYILNFIFSAVIFIPAVGVRIIFAGADTVEILVSVLGLLLIPCFAMSFSSLLGWLLAVISSKMRSKNLVSLILSLVFMGAYFYFCFNAGDFITYLGKHGTELADSVRSILFPAYHFGMAASGSIESLIIALLCAIVPFIIVTFLISRNFVKISTTKVGNSVVRYKEKSVRASSCGKALFKKELIRPFATSSVFLNTCTGDFLMVIIAVVMVIKLDGIKSFSEAFGLGVLPLCAILTVVITLCSAMNTLSSSSVSLEAKTLWLLKSLPVKAESLLFAKAEAHFALCSGAAVIAGIIATAVAKPTAIEILALFLTPITASAVTALAGVLINLHMPKFNWLNEISCVKQSGSVLVHMLVNLAVIVLPLILYFAAFNASIDINIYLIIASAFYAVVAAVLALRVKTAGVKMFENL